MISPLLTQHFTPMRPNVVAPRGSRSRCRRASCAAARARRSSSRCAPSRRRRGARQTCTLTPLAPERIALVSARFIARRKATRFCNCSAIDCATSFASSSGRLISRMLTLICFWVMRCRSRRRASTSVPDLPITMPGRAVWMLTSSSPESLRIVMSESPAWARRSVMCRRMRMSSAEILGEVSLVEPVGLPVVDVAHAHCLWVNLLSHLLSSLFHRLSLCLCVSSTTAG